MGNQAQQRQELELWPMMGSSGDTRPRPRRANSRRSDQITVMNPNAPRTSDRRSTSRTVRTTASGRNTARTVRTSAPVRNVGSARTTRAVRSAYAVPDRQRMRSPRPYSPRPYPTRTKTNVRTAKKKKAGRRARKAQIFAFLWIVAMSVVIFCMGKIFIQNMQKSPVMKEDRIEQTPVEEEVPVVDNDDSDTRKPNIREDFLTISEYNRPGTELACVKNIFVHYTANPKTSAAQNRSYFENLGQTHERAASAHFIIGYEGEIVQCIPLDEEAYAVMGRNGDSISIECCCLEKNGAFTQETYDSLIEMLAWLLEKYDLGPEDILRHYDCGGKKCPLYYVEHEDAWERLIEDVRQYMNDII